MTWSFCAKGVGILLLAYLGVIFITYSLQEHLLFFPDREDLKTCPHIKTSEQGEIVTDKVDPSIRYIALEALHPQVAVIFFHGNAGSACDRVPALQNLVNPWVSVYLVEYPGYSEGDQIKQKRPINQERLLDNALKAFAAIQARLNAKQASHHSPFTVSTVLFGESLGSSVATYVATQNRPAGLILQSPFPSFPKLAKKKYPLLPIGLLLKSPFPTEEWAAQLAPTTQVLLLHGEKDQLIPVSFVHDLAKAFKVPYQLKTFREVSHNDFEFLAWDEYYSTLRLFLKQFYSANP
jgi:pimeloyl-ACP methyl ester carboxylesterase